MSTHNICTYVLMSTHNICFHGEIKNISTFGLKKNPHLIKIYASGTGPVDS